MDDVEAASALDPSFFSLKVSRVPARSERRKLVGWAPARGIHILSLKCSKKIYTRSVAPEYFITFVGYGVGLADCNWLNGVHYVLVSSSATVLASQAFTPPAPWSPRSARHVACAPGTSKAPTLTKRPRTRLESKNETQYEYQASLNHVAMREPRRSSQPTHHRSETLLNPRSAPKEHKQDFLFGFTTLDNFVRQTLLQDRFRRRTRSEQRIHNDFQPTPGEMLARNPVRTREHGRIVKITHFIR